MTIKGNRRTPRIDSACDERRRGAGVSARQSGLAQEADIFTATASRIAATSITPLLVAFVYMYILTIALGDVVRLSGRLSLPSTALSGYLINETSDTTPLSVSSERH